MIRSCSHMSVFHLLFWFERLGRSRVTWQNVSILLNFMKCYTFSLCPFSDRWSILARWCFLSKWSNVMSGYKWVCIEKQRESDLTVTDSCKVLLWVPYSWCWQCEFSIWNAEWCILSLPLGECLCMSAGVALAEQHKCKDMHRKGFCDICEGMLISLSVFCSLKSVWKYFLNISKTLSANR